LRLIIVTAVYLIAAVLSYGLTHYPGLVAERYGIIHMVSGEAHNPFVRRALVPFLVRITHSVLPRSIKDSINSRAENYIGTSGIRESYDEPESEQRFDTMEGKWSIAIVAIAFIVLSLFGFLFALRKALIIFYHPPPLIADFFPLLVLVFLPVFANFSNFIYDYANLFLFTICLIFMFGEKWLLYYIFLCLAVLNKETAILLPAVFAVYYLGRMEKKRYLTHVILQFAVGIGLIGILILIFRNNPGGVAEFHIGYNLIYLSDIKNLFLFEPFRTCPLAPGGLKVYRPVGCNLPFWGIIIAFVAFGWRKSPRFIRIALPVVAIPLLAAMPFFGLVNEIRAVYEALPLILLLLYSTADRIWQISARNPAVTLRATPS